MEGEENFTELREEDLIENFKVNPEKYNFEEFVKYNLVSINGEIYKLGEKLEVAYLEDYKDSEKIGVWILDKNKNKLELIVLKIENGIIFEEKNITLKQQLENLKDNINGKTKKLGNFEISKNFKLEKTKNGINKIIFVGEGIENSQNSTEEQEKSERDNYLKSLGLDGNRKRDIQEGENNLVFDTNDKNFKVFFDKMLKIEGLNGKIKELIENNFKGTYGK